MSLQDLRKKIDAIMNVIYAGGLANHGAIIELMIYIIFLRELHKHDQEQALLDDNYSPVLSGELAIYQWDNILSLNADALFTHLSDAFEKIADKSTNKTVKMLYNKAHIKLFAKPALRTVVHKIEEMMTALESEERTTRTDLFGDLYEYLLSKLTSAGTAGQFRTPRHLIKFIVDIIDPQAEESICDPACGTGGFFVAALNYLKHKYTSEQFQETGRFPMDLLTERQQNFFYNQAFSGFDSDPDMIKFGLMNLYFHKLENATIKRRNTLVDTQGETTKWDIILANPPFAGSLDRTAVTEELQMDTGATEVLFLNYMIRHLTDRGRCGVIVPEGVIFKAARAHKTIRQKLVEEAGLWAVVSLPGGVFEYAGVKTSILFFDKTKKESNDEIIFIKITDDGFTFGANRQPHDKNDLPCAVEILNSWKESQKIPQSCLSGLVPKSIATAVAKTKIVESGDYNLSGDRYRETVDHSHVKWPIVKLGDVCETVSGGTPLKSKTQYYEGGNIPWIRSGEVAQGYVEKSELFITENGLKNSSAKILPINTVLVAMYGATAGQVGILKFESATNQAVCGILPNDKVIPEFLFHLLKSQRNIMLSFAGGGAQPNISQGVIRNLKIPLPPLDVQEKIVAELGGYQKIITGAKQITENWKPKIEIDPEWEKLKLGEVGKISMCKRIFKRQTTATGDIPFFKIGTFGKTPNAFIGREIFDDYRTRFSYPKKGEILISTSGTIGKTVVFDGKPAYFQDSNIVWIENDEKKVYNNYLNLIFQDIDWITTKGGTIERLYNKLIEEQVISVPPLETQKIIVEKIEAERALVESAKKLIDIYEQKTKDVIAKLWNE